MNAADNLPPHFRARVPVAARRQVAHFPARATAQRFAPRRTLGALKPGYYPLAVRRVALSGRTLGGALGALGLNAQTSSAAGGAQQGAAVGTAIMPGIGTAIGAIVGAVYGWAGGKQPSHAESTWDSYKSQAGTGLLVTLSDSDEAEVWKGAYDTNNKFFNFSGIKSRRGYIEWLVNLLQRSVASGQITPASTPKQIVDTIVYPAMKAGGSHLNDSSTMHGFLGDIVSRLFAGLPIHNERTKNVALQPVAMSVPSSFGTAAPPSVTQSPIGPTTSIQSSIPISAPAQPAAQPVQATTVSQSVPADMTQYIDSLKAQGANNQAIMDSVLTKLQQQGIATTPQVQAQVADQITGTGGFPTWGYFALAAGAVLLFGFSRRRR